MNIDLQLLVYACTRLQQCNAATLQQLKERWCDDVIPVWRESLLMCISVRLIEYWSTTKTVQFFMFLENVIQENTV